MLPITAVPSCLALSPTSPAHRSLLILNRLGRAQPNTAFERGGPAELGLDRGVAAFPRGVLLRPRGVLLLAREPAEPGRNGLAVRGELDRAPPDFASRAGVPPLLRAGD